MTRKDQLHDVRLDLIDVGVQLIRHDPNDEDVAELALQIQAETLLEPIGLRPNPDGRYQLLYGGRRLAAHRRLKRKTIQAIYKDVPDEKIKIVAAMENLGRRNLTLAEEVDLVCGLNKEEDMSPNEIADRLAKTRDWVLRRLRLPAMPEDIQEFLMSGQLALGAAEEICRLDSEAKRMFLTQQVIARRPTIREVRAMVHELAKVEESEERVRPAIEHAMAQVADQPIKSDCGVCGSTLPLDALMMVYVCKDGCPDPPAADDPGHKPLNGGE